MAESAGPAILARATHLAYGALRYPRLHAAQWFSPDHIRDVQWRRLERMLHYAYVQSPLYRERFRQAGMTPADIRSTDDLRLLPVTTREDLRQPEALLAEGYPRHRLRSSTTSGSTGRRTTTYFDEPAWVLAKNLLKLRARQACGVRPWDRVALFQEDAPDQTGARSGGRRQAFTIHRPIEEILPAVRAFAPTVLYGFAGYFARLARAAGNGVRPRMVFTSGELLDAATRRAIETGLGAPVLDVYGCTEVKEIAWQCPAREGYHVNADWLLVEVDSDDPAPGRQAGRLLVTSLYNFAMPLLRYDVGDAGFADPWLLGTPGGTVDLRTGIMRKATAEDYITKIASVAPAAPGTKPVRWLAFLDRITNGDKELQAYLQRFAGYALTGSTREHTFNYGHGTGANGKSVWIEALKGILGEYACSFPTEMLMVTQNDRHPTEIARMRGCRLAIGSETEEGRQWAESKIKSLTGGDTIAARFMHKDFFEYRPQFKLFIVGNHKPGLRCVDEAMRRRLHFVPFLVTIPPEERDKDLSAKLQEEWPAILRWAIDGCLAWQQQGLNPPECVQVATNEYLSSEDAFEVWRAECLIEDKNAWSSSKDLWKSWKQWAEAAGEFVGKQRALSDRLLQIGCKSYAHPRTRARGYRGVQIQPTDDVKVAPWAA